MNILQTTSNITKKIILNSEFWDKKNEINFKSIKLRHKYSMKTLTINGNYREFMCLTY